ncbi:MAG: phospho-N-acetylmuramoyl-pentapeptide-transferase [Christensenellales bacterium]|jgi:phospho-N-acetylmuramoyl-pentapeptide-transferase
MNETAALYAPIPKDMALTVVLSFAVCLVLGALLIPWLTKLKFGQNVRDDGPKSHLQKQGTPTMGGLAFIGAMVVGALAMSPSGGWLIPALVATLGYGLIGFLDDIIKVAKRRSLGLKAYQKLVGQVGLALAVAFWAYGEPGIGSGLIMPFTSVVIDIGVLYIPVMAFIIVGIVNSVNLIDGLDGLAAGVNLVIAATFTIIFYFMAGAVTEAGLQDSYHSMMIVSAALCGALLGFLRFNAYPAKIFMGDTGSLALGGALSVMTVTSRLALLLPIVAGMLVATTLSVIIQVLYYKKTKKRVFRMAPLHHHFELGGMPETRIVAMYMIITAVLCIIGFVSLA